MCDKLQQLKTLKQDNRLPYCFYLYLEGLNIKYEDNKLLGIKEILYLCFKGNQASKNNTLEILMNLYLMELKKGKLLPEEVSRMFYIISNLLTEYGLKLDKYLLWYIEIKGNQTYPYNMQSEIEFFKGLFNSLKGYIKHINKKVCASCPLYNTCGGDPSRFCHNFRPINLLAPNGCMTCKNANKCMFVTADNRLVRQLMECDQQKRYIINKTSNNNIKK